MMRTKLFKVDCGLLSFGNCLLLVGFFLFTYSYEPYLVL